MYDGKYPANPTSGFKEADLVAARANAGLLGSKVN